VVALWDPSGVAPAFSSGRPFEPRSLQVSLRADWFPWWDDEGDSAWRIPFAGDNLATIHNRRASRRTDQPRNVNPDDLTVSDPIETHSRPESRLLVSLATYNEAGNLRPLVETIRQFAPGSSILIIDDNSPDGTGKIADELARALPAIHVIHRPGKLGLGTAMLEAITFAVRNQYDYLLNLDADFSHPPRFIPALLEGMRDHDVMIGSRYVPGGGVEGGFTLKRKFMSSGINWYARILLGLTSKDNSGAYRCYRVSRLAQIDLNRVRSRGYSFQEEILFWCKRVGCRIGETPILFENRRSGTSKINMREAASALWILFQLGLSRVRG
jgi:dolichol-phosphate mannosyltransferase